jgi:hypothetical protein
MNYEVVCWPESQMIMNKVGFFENCRLINSIRGLEEYGSSAYLVDKDWYQKVLNGEIPETDLFDDDEELDVCYDDEIIFGDDYEDDDEDDD